MAGRSKAALALDTFLLALAVVSVAVWAMDPAQAPARDDEDLTRIARAVRDPQVVVTAVLPAGSLRLGGEVRMHQQDGHAILMVEHASIETCTRLVQNQDIPSSGTGITINGVAHPIPTDAALCVFDGTGTLTLSWRIS